MHIMEGFLPVEHAVGWSVVSLPFLAVGVHSLQRRLLAHPEQRMLFGVAAAFAFLLSALKLPSLTGSSSHPTGIGLGSLLFGPLAMVPVGFVVLLFQALLLAHGGLTTLGANLFSLAIIGPCVACGVYRLARLARVPFAVAVFLAAALADLATYSTTSLQLALAFPDPLGGIAGSFVKFSGVFAFTQIPLAIAEGLLTVMIVNALLRFNAEEVRTFLRLPEVRA